MLLPLPLLVPPPLLVVPLPLMLPLLMPLLLPMPLILLPLHSSWHLGICFLLFEVDVNLPDRLRYRQGGSRGEACAPSRACLPMFVVASRFSSPRLRLL